MTGLRRTSVAAALVLVVLVVATGCGGSTATSGSVSTTTASPTTAAGSGCTPRGGPTTVAYERIGGVAVDLTSLDIHAPAKPCRAPVVMWVHGGGYRIGDKAQQLRDKISLFNGHGWILVSVNYRLTVPGDPTSANFPDHFTDVAAAVSWVHDNIATYGGDPSRVALLGHSAGADIVSNVAGNPTYLAAHDLGLDALTCAGPLDTEGFDKVAAGAGEPGAEKQQWKVALGDNPDYLTETSATRFVRPGTSIPPTIGVVRGTRQRQEIETAYLAALEKVGVETTSIDARTLTHSQVSNQIGAAGDTVMTAPLIAFLTGCFGR